MNIFKKLDAGIVRDIENNILKWIWIRRYKTPIFILAVLLLILISKAPYINLFFNSYLIIFISAILAPLILDIEYKPLFTFSIILFTLALVLWFYDRDSAEAITNYIFIILFSGVIKIIFSG
ncbi:hypothetical protein A3F00_02910 [Candidatus Daviesbacteria bacterium RIFCSPHIGHO2_12_FULL_37_11]|uniref:Uncharacterized protein n=1 Tax=Candidatus Daviesbacteria bacterium RIFCSPHIGHO2_12_FULL_37_11 TaxID=1797777 RepID=A0A1F5KBS0_9BACT|nr:MAG: hypothetical protein A2769_04200 [Candidatus Daviesbacteria bacterium RIFCSPHIGHO2_01_FULL_37_27]OGE38250.1 MAG: hypothetical protein A3F00_02910 [Candidatus Daviesbacteria bacterium RIFCSPHIGHO2_12_FULL_37_11]OGE46207.1 MAG: hypothetical protein A3B39_02675 [Candidatus Daviesbacteria bacterium RIFCSPLOWO2_01_FULL_37_10]